MAIEMFEYSYQHFNLYEMTWTCCPVITHGGWGWSDSQPNCDPENGDRSNPIIYPVMGWEYSHGMKEVVSYLPNLTPEPGWTVIGINEHNQWVAVPLWYLFPPPKKELSLVKALAALAVGALVLWGGIQLLPQAGVNPPQTIYKSK